MMLTGRWFPQIVDYKGQWESISNLYITKLGCLFLNLFAGDLG